MRPICVPQRVELEDQAQSYFQFPIRPTARHICDGLLVDFFLSVSVGWVESTRKLKIRMKA